MAAEAIDYEHEVSRFEDDGCGSHPREVVKAAGVTAVERLIDPMPEPDPLETFDGEGGGQTRYIV